MELITVWFGFIFVREKWENQVLRGFKVESVDYLLAVFFLKGRSARILTENAKGFFVDGFARADGHYLDIPLAGKAINNSHVFDPQAAESRKLIAQYLAAMRLESSGKRMA